MSKVTITRRNFVKIGVVAGTLLAGGDIHFNLYVPEGVSGAAGQTAPATAGGRDLASSTAAGASSFAPPAPSASPNATMPAAFTDPEPAQPVALFVTLPGYQGLYFQGVGENLRTEDFGFEAQAYDPTMIVVAPQLSDWGRNLGAPNHRAGRVAATRVQHRRRPRVPGRLFRRRRNVVPDYGHHMGGESATKFPAVFSAHSDSKAPASRPRITPNFPPRTPWLALFHS
ncbi:hypothetical protein [Senegalimassilia faecalis]|uniref:hypothetical protein n=1 Tax=Senegalimassilia faecalis TaxID=2509433 RepID=UPI0030789E17